MEDIYTGQWIEIIRQSKEPNSKKITDVFHVVNKENRCMLGVIKWFGSFRQYSFFPEAQTVFEHKCLKDITAFLDAIMLEHKTAKQK